VCKIPEQKKHGHQTSRHNTTKDLKSSRKEKTWCVQRSKNSDIRFPREKGISTQTEMHALDGSWSFAQSQGGKIPNVH
jgi:hypothetical protein